MGRCNDWGWRRECQARGGCWPLAFSSWLVSISSGRFHGGRRASLGWTDECVRPYVFRGGRSPKLGASSLLAHCGVAKGVVAGEINLARDQAVVVDATGFGVSRAGIDDALEVAILVDESEVAIGRKMIADDHTGVVHCRQNGAIPRVRVVDGREGSVFPEEAAAHGAAGVGSDNVAVVIDGQGIGYLRIGISDGGVVAVH